MTTLTDVAALEALYGTPDPRSIVKETDHVHAVYRPWIEAAPFAVLATNGPGGLDASPRGDGPGFVVIQDPKINERLQVLIRQKNVKSQEEAQAVQKEFVIKLQRDMIEQLQREGRVAMLPKLKKEAQEELIEERLKLQEAKRLGIEISDDEVGRIIKGIAERNKITPEQFAQQIKGSGVDISTMRERLRAQFAWREVVRRRGQMLVSINERDVERMMSASASEAGEDTVELQVQRITLLTPAPTDQAAMARRYAEADALRRRFGGCNTMPGLAKEASEAKYEDLKYIKPGSVPEPTRTMLLSAKDGDMLPPATAAAGIEVYAVCGRRAIKTGVARVARRGGPQSLDRPAHSRFIQRAELLHVDRLFQGVGDDIDFG